MSTVLPWTFVTVDRTSGAPDYVLPDADTVVGRVVLVKVVPGAAGAIVRAPLHQLIDSSTTYSINAGEAAAFQARAGKWHVVAAFSSTLPLHHTTHEDGGADEISVSNLSGRLADAQKVTIRKNTGADIGTQQRLNLIEGSNITLTIADDPGSQEVDIQIDASGGGAGNSVAGIVSFGSPGESDTATVTVAAVWVAAGTEIVCSVVKGSTGDHDDEDAAIEELVAYPMNINAGVGFDIMVMAPNGAWGRYGVQAIGV